MGPTSTLSSPSASRPLAGNVCKHHTRQDVPKAEHQCTWLIEPLTYTYAGLKAVGQQGEALGHLLVFVTCSEDHVHNLIRRRRPHCIWCRLVIFISSTPADGGLGVSPDSPEWYLVESIFPLHNRKFNEHLIRAWTPHYIASVRLEKIREQRTVDMNVGTNDPGVSLFLTGIEKLLFEGPLDLLICIEQLLALLDQLTFSPYDQ
ncbi:hypothetical protein K443DRAFT_4086 [Laccaria amethystina LaAM-08-1]|uniref:Anoctamin alpha-beta plait domain-containing protein n=1 Tax=Laccaria amethystina LaAM-08-1 TaxID=1095629 RepID=A0A0C9XTT7_9AGAR|nr:hypothetical protein K443DRAFT_4086 [Laccaria amethystina LaAM-08-1]